jgi:hypothetical protein
MTMEETALEEQARLRERERVVRWLRLQHEFNYAAQVEAGIHIKHTIRLDMPVTELPRD